MIEKKGKICYRCMEIYEDDSRKCPLCGFDVTNPHTYPCKERTDAFPVGSIFLNRYLVGCVVLNDYFEIVYAGLDLYTEKKVFIHEFFPSEIVSRKADNCISVIAQEDKKIFQKGKELYQNRFHRIKAEIPYSEQILFFQEENGTSYMIGEAYSFVSLKDMLHHKPFIQYLEEYFSVLHALKDNLAALGAVGEQYYDIAPDRVFIGKGKVVILAGGEEKYQFARSFSSKLIIPDMKYCPPEFAAGKTSDSEKADIYSFSALCYYIITLPGALEAETHNKKGKAFQSQHTVACNGILTKNRNKKLMNVVKKRNIPFALSDSIVAGITENPAERSKDYSGYAVLDEYTSLPTESFFQKSNAQVDDWKEKGKKTPHFKIIAGILAVTFLFSAVFYFLISNIEKRAENSTPSPAATEKPIPSSTPTVSPTPTPTMTPTPDPTTTASPTVTPTIKPAITPTINPTKKPEVTKKPATTPTKKPTYTKKPITRPVPRVTAKPIEPTVRPTVTPRDKVKATKKPAPKPTQKIKEEEIEGIN